MPKEMKVKKKIRNQTKSKKALRLILPILVILLLALGVCYIVLPWQAPTATINNEVIELETITFDAKVSRSLQTKECQIILEKEAQIVSSCIVNTFNEEVSYEFNELAPNTAYSIIIEYTNLNKKVIEILKHPFISGNGSVVTSDDLSIHFLELGNKYAGDSVYIKAGETDILIDAGSRASSSTTIHNYLNNYVTDGKLEYVIATHAHQDHIAGFIGTKANPGIFSLYETDVIIDYAKSDNTSQTRKNYETLRAEEVALGAKHYTALDCINETNNASTVFNLATGITMTILDSYYYKNKSSDENNYSVCLLITKDEKNFLFTGDLEKEGEEELVKLNDLPQVEIFKAGHHGSPTSSNTNLLEVIKPKRVCVCCCAGATEYTSNKDNTFPSQAFIDRISSFTDQIYVTTLCVNYSAGIYESMNGNIVATITNEVVINGSNNNTILKDTKWFQDNRVWPQL